MPIGPRTIQCDIPECGVRALENNGQFGTGFAGWMVLSGIELNGVLNPAICPGHVAIVMPFVDKLRGPPE